MRISGWLIGVVAFVAIIACTGIFAVIAYSGTRSIVIDLWDQGLRVDSPAEVLSAFTDPQSLEVAATNQPIPPVAALFDATPIPNEGVLVLRAAEQTNVPPSPTPTPFSTQAANNGSSNVAQQAALPTNTPAPTVDPAAQYQLNDPRQRRILLMGIDQRTAAGETGPFRTDTMMVVNVDPVRNTAGLISFPRDLWVDIPNYQPARINTAHFLGDRDAYPGGGGPRLAMETIAANFGIRVDSYLVINFDVFETTMDLLAPNGVEVCVDEYIYDDRYPDDFYGYITVEFQVGCQQLDAERLLQYARTRRTEGSDFDRARRQQKTIDAVLNHLLSVGGISQFISQIPNLWNELSDSYKTNLSLNEIISLGLELNEIDLDNINYAVIDRNYVELGVSPDGAQDILLPIRSRINDLIQRTFYPQADLTTADLRTRADNENATIRVFNGTNIAGLAGRTREWLLGRGVTVTDVGNAPDHNGGNTVIRDYGNNRWTALYLAELLGLSAERVQPGTDGLAANGIVLVVGPDIQPLLGGP